MKRGLMIGVLCGVLGVSAWTPVQAETTLTDAAGAVVAAAPLAAYTVAAVAWLPGQVGEAVAGAWVPAAILAGYLLETYNSCDDAVAIAGESKKWFRTPDGLMAACGTHVGGRSRVAGAYTMGAPNFAR